MGIIRKIWQQILKLAWKLVEVLRIKSFVVSGVGKNLLLARIYNLAIAGLQADSPIMINNYKMRITQEGGKGGWIGTNMLIKGTYELQTTQVFKQILKEGMVAVDVGAHIGYFTLLASTLVGESGEVFAFEPEPQNFATLLENIELNGFKNIESYQKAVYSCTGKLPLYIGIHSGMHSLFRVKDTTAETVVVDMVSLDGFLGQRKVDLVKVDTQGAELDVLIGMQGIIKHNKNLKLIIEFQPNLEHKGATLRGLWSKLTDFGFDYIYVIDESGERIQETSYQYAVDFCKRRRIEGLNLLCTKQFFKEA